ncbi:MAG TPA: hypothetical protein VKB57_06760 [Acidimicrobiales bacterium]|nr:hypothetical protein [Acidimicrobiales bacterium]
MAAPTRLRRRRRGALVAVAALVLLAGPAACVPVTPSTAFETWSFEGFDVVSSIPDDPVGLVWLFHGTGGGARFATRVETVDTLNELLARGYGFVATESTERTGDRRWDVVDPSPATNPDLARLARLQQHLIDTTGVTASTPLLGLGMSNGARFVSLWGQEWADAGQPVRSVALYMGRIAAPVTAAGGLTVPAWFVTAENDVTVPPVGVLADYGRAVSAGTPAGLSVAREQPLAAARFLRIPGVDAGTADATFAALVATGAWDAAGTRQVPIDEAIARAASADLPAAARPVANEVANQVALVLAVHQMRGDVKVPVADFFDAHLSPS